MILPILPILPILAEKGGEMGGIAGEISQVSKAKATFVNRTEKHARHVTGMLPPRMACFCLFYDVFPPVPAWFPVLVIQAVYAHAAARGNVDELVFA